MVSKIKKPKTDFLSSVFEHILNISKGQCVIDDTMIISTDTEIEQRILQGLLYLHEDLELYKIDLRNSMETEYQVKILETKNKQLEQFNYVASHDLQEPLRTISNFSQLLSNEYSNDLDDTANQYLRFIIQSSEHMRNLILGLLNFSRLGKGSVLALVNCQKIIQELQVDLRASIEKKNAIITTEGLPQLWGYEMELRQLFQNLISNALKFSDKNRKTTIHISCKKNKTAYLFCIQDNGIGIQKKYYDKIFILFQRLHHRNNYEGTGIGLSNCRKIIELHHGNIWVESTFEKGSSFFFTIPYLKSKPT